MISVGSSALGENSYSHHSDKDVGVAVIDRFTYFTLEFLEKSKGKKSIQDLFDYLNNSPLMSTADYRSDLLTNNEQLSNISSYNFFGGGSEIVLTPHLSAAEALLSSSPGSSSSSLARSGSTRDRSRVSDTYNSNPSSSSSLSSEDRSDIEQELSQEELHKMKVKGLHVTNDFYIVLAGFVGFFGIASLANKFI